MEQRPDSLNPVVLSAGTDPTYIPGLGAPGSGEPEQTDAPEPADPAERTPPDDASPDEAAADGPAAEDAAGDEAPAGDSSAEDEEESPGEDPDAGPVFEVSDRRGTIRADGTGVTFRLDDTEARIDWDEIGAVEIDTPRFGRRFSVTVYTTDHRHFEGDVEAPARKLLSTWTADLDAALDTWFEGGDA